MNNNYSYNGYLQFLPGETDLSHKPWFDPDFFVETRFTEIRSALHGSLDSRYENFPKLNSESRLYIDAHCGRGSNHILDDFGNAMDYRELAGFLSKLLIDSSLRRPIAPFLKISLIACEAALGTEANQHRDSFAALLQEELKKTYGIYVDMVARVLAVGILENRSEKFTEINTHHLRQEIEQLQRKLIRLKLSCDEDLERIQEVETIIADKESLLLSNFRHHRPGSKVSYRWLPYGRCRIREDVYAAKISLKEMERIRQFIIGHPVGLAPCLYQLLANHTTLPVDVLVCFLKEGIRFSSEGVQANQEIVDQLRSFLMCIEGSDFFQGRVPTMYLT